MSLWCSYSLDVQKNVPNVPLRGWFECLNGIRLHSERRTPVCRYEFSFQISILLFFTHLICLLAELLSSSKKTPVFLLLQVRAPSPSLSLSVRRIWCLKSSCCAVNWQRLNNESGSSTRSFHVKRQLLCNRSRWRWSTTRLSHHDLVRYSPR